MSEHNLKLSLENLSDKRLAATIAPYIIADTAAAALAAEFWRGECNKRAEFLRFCERGGSDVFGGGVCLECGQAINHGADCPMPNLMQMPEEPKP